MAYSNIKQPNLYFNTKLYTGNGGTNNITGVGFQPDMTWIKCRSGTHGTENHNLFDAVRGVTKYLIPNGTTPSTTDTNSLTAFGSDGFSLGTRTDVNGSGEYASWNWLANGAGSANTDGSISSTVSANTTSGFSIVTFTGNSGTVGHGLGVKPNFIVVKSRQTGGSNNWVVTHSALGTNMNDNYIILNLTDAAGSGSNTWGGEPTTTTFTVSSGVAANDNNVAYCFAEKTGYSKFGKYIGNGNTDGSFIYTGFKPAFIILKNVSAAGTNWVMFDNKRIGYNESNYYLRPNGNNTESTNIPLDILSNGFKIRTTATDVNGSGYAYIYMAFAEEPLVGDNPATAR